MARKQCTQVKVSHLLCKLVDPQLVPLALVPLRNHNTNLLITRTTPDNLILRSTNAPATLP